MKKIIVLTVILFLALPVFANQFLYRQSSPEVQTLLLLAKLSSTALPNATYPLTGDTLKSYLSLLDKSSFTPQMMNLYNNVIKSLEEKEFLFKSQDSGFLINAPFTVLQAWTGNLPFKDRLALLNLDVDLQITEVFAGEVDFDLRAEPYNTTKISENFNFLSPYNLFKDLSHQFPTKAYGSLGKGAINLTIGRDRLAAGHSKTGNLALSENFLYQDFAKFSLSKGALSYDLTLLAWDNPEDENTVSVYNFKDSYKSALIHRFSVIFKKAVTASVYEGHIIYAPNPFSDVRSLNPLMMIHNTYTYDNGNTNNFFGAEVNVSLPKGIRVNLQGILDQFKLKDETDDSSDAAWGLLFNTEGAWELGKGILSAYTEFVYNSKYLYLKELVNPFPGNADSKYYQIDMIGVNKYFSAGYEQNYIGYPHGTDLTVFALGASYLYSNRNFSLDLMYKVKGKFGIGTNEVRTIPNSDEPVNEKTFSLLLSSDGEIIKGINYKVTTGLINITNLNHIKGAENADKLHFSATITVDPLVLIKDQKKK